MTPIKLKVYKNKSLIIVWNDKKESNIDLKLLRSVCPCATCNSERESRNRTYIPLFLTNQLTIDAIEIVGNYAIQIKWKDGHSTGIYEFSFLMNLAKDSVQA